MASPEIWLGDQDNRLGQSLAGSGGGSSPLFEQNFHKENFHMLLFGVRGTDPISKKIFKTVENLLKN